jgi:hypothetical protein
MNGMGRYAMSLSLESSTSLTLQLLQYLVPWGRLWHPRADTEDEAAAKKLWEIMEAETKDL